MPRDESERNGEISEQYGRGRLFPPGWAGITNGLMSADGPLANSLMFLRALVAFFAVPGVVAFAIPVLWFGYEAHLKPSHPFAVVFVVAGLGALLRCVRDFYVAGKGTLVPWAPPEKLVTVGLYRYSRNPMYASVMFILFGWAIVFASETLLAYALFFAVLFQLRVLYGEEPRLERTFGEEWQRYANRVPRWIRMIRDHEPLKIDHRI